MLKKILPGCITWPRFPWKFWPTFPLGLVKTSMNINSSTKRKWMAVNLLSGYNAGQKKRNSELRIFRVPPEGGGSTLNTVQHTQCNSKFNHLQSWSTSSRELRKINGSELRFFWPALYYNLKHIQKCDGSNQELMKGIRCLINSYNSACAMGIFTDCVEEVKEVPSRFWPPVGCWSCL